MSKDDHKYDVAISFVNTDLGSAKALADGLSPHVKVFLYVDRQEDLAGTDGLESFRRAFRYESRLVVVLFRRGWGETNWTRIEQQAIEERFLKEGPRFLFFIMLDGVGDPPPWLPENLIRLKLDDYGMEQAIGAIKLRLSDLGAAFKKETLLDRAKKAHDIDAHHNKTKSLWGSEEGVRQVNEAATQLIAEIAKHAAQIKEGEPGLNLNFGSSEATDISIVLPKASIVVWLDNRFVNSLDHAKLKVLLYRTKLLLPGEQRHYVFGHPEPIDELHFLPERVFGLDWCWKKDSKVFTAPELADKVIGLLLDQISGKPKA